VKKEGRDGSYERNKGAGAMKKKGQTKKVGEGSPLALGSQGLGGR